MAIQLEFSYYAISYIFLLTTGALIILLAGLVLRSLYSLLLIWLGGIPVLQPGLGTLFSLFDSDPKKLFESLSVDLKHGNGLMGWLTPVGKPFLVISDEKVLAQVIVDNQSKLTKHHAFGILEHFRKTDLISGAAWKVVHRIASKFPIKDSNLQQRLEELLRRYCDDVSTAGDFAEYTKDVRDFDINILLLF